MRQKYLNLLMASASVVLSTKLDIANREATIYSANALAAPVSEGAVAATHPWISASAYTTMLHYWHYTGDSQYNNKVTGAILGQAGGSKDFGAIGLSPGNDDQLWWGIACITAAEYGIGDFTKPISDGGNTNNWLAMATNVFNAVTSRWQEDSCGGLGWQRPESSIVNGTTYRNAITNGLAFQLAARLGRYTGDKKHTDSADSIFAWALKAGFIDKASYSVYDGVHTANCTVEGRDPNKWTYNAGVFLYGTAVMLEHTGNTAWQQHLDGFIGAVKTDFTKDDDNILAEPCESGTCDADQKTFKATLVRWLALTSRLVPDTAAKIQPILDASAKAALSSCNDQSRCSAKWTARAFNETDLGAQMAAVEVTGAQLAKDCKLPMKAATNGAGMTSDTASTNGSTTANSTVSTSNPSIVNSTMAASSSVPVGGTTGLTTDSVSVPPTVSAAGAVSSTAIGSLTVSTSSTDSISTTVSTSTTVSISSTSNTPSSVTSSAATSVPTTTTLAATTTVSALIADSLPTATHGVSTGSPASAGTPMSTRTPAAMPTSAVPSSSIPSGSTTNVKRTVAKAFTA